MTTSRAPQDPSAPGAAAPRPSPEAAPHDEHATPPSASDAAGAAARSSAPGPPDASAHREFMPYPGDAYQAPTGRRVWELGEDGGETVLVEGHGPAARNAIVDFLVEHQQQHRIAAASSVARASEDACLREYHVAFLTSCGCSVHDHRMHTKLVKVRGGVPDDVQQEVCQLRCAVQGMLPPCALEQAPQGWSLPSWVPLGVPATDARALPVTAVALEDLAQVDS